MCNVLFEVRINLFNIIRMSIGLRRLSEMTVFWDDESLDNRGSKVLWNFGSTYTRLHAATSHKRVIFIVLSGYHSCIRQVSSLSLAPDQLSRLIFSVVTLSLYKQMLE